MNPEPDPRATRSPGRFATTRWSVVLAAGRRDEPAAAGALEALCEAYWYPLYAEARRRGLDAEAAGDRVQGFFARLLEKGDLADADRARGRFRTFLLAAFRHFLANARDHEEALKRGGGRARIALDLAAGESRYGVVPAHEETAERIFDRRWALALIERALGRLREQYARSGKEPLFEALKDALSGDRGVSLAEHAARLGMSEGAVKVAVHRMRARCGDLIRAEVAETVATPEEVDDELRLLFAALAP